MITNLYIKAGILIVPLVLLGIIAFSLITLKSLHIFEIKKYIKKQNRLNEIKEKKLEMITNLNMKNPVDRIINLTIEINKTTKTTHEKKEQLEIIYEKEIHSIDNYLSLINTLGEIAPMIGLLGTITGMINVFDTLAAFGTSNQALLSNGISKALITTQLGLIFSIPILISYTILNNKITKIDHYLREITTNLNSKLY